MGLYDSFDTNKDYETEGVVLDYGKNADGSSIQIRVARAGGSNIRFAKRLEALSRPYRRAIQTENMDPKIAERILREVYADAVILGWTGVQDKEGNDIPYTRENVLKVLEDLPDLLADIREQASLARTFREEELRDDLGN